jgi:N-carbamoylputrescine amidase
MREQVTIGLVQMAMGDDREANIEKAFAMAGTAREQGAELIVLPELFSGIYFCKYPGARRYNAWAEPVPDGPLSSRLAKLARELEAVVVASVYEFVQDGLYFNTAVVYERDGSYLGKSRKMHIPETGPGYQEKYYFAPGDSDYPVFRTSLIDLAVPTCWDQWYPEVARLARLKGADLVVYPTCIGDEPAEPDLDTSDPWQIVMRGHAVANSIYVAACNRVGVEDGQGFYGRSFVSDPNGAKIGEAGRGTEEVVVAALSRETLRQVRDCSQFLRDRRPESYGGLLQRCIEE